MTWLKIENAPFDRDLELAVIDYDGTHALAFPCRRILGGWVKAVSKARVEVRRTGGSGIHPKIKAASVGGHHLLAQSGDPGMSALAPKRNLRAH